MRLPSRHARGIARWAAAAGGRLCVAAAALLLATAAGAQAPLPDEAPPDDSPRVVEGQVVRPAGDTLRGLPGVWVVLHRVSRDAAGPLDSMRTAAEGRFRFRYRPSGDPRAIYFLSADHHGIAYFSPALPPGDARGDVAELIVYDTASAGIPIRLQGRHIVVSAARVDGLRDVVEVFELANETGRTLVSPDEVAPTWVGSLPAAAADVRIGEGDVPAEALDVRDGAIRVTAPIAPGLKQFSLAYRLPESAFPLRFAMAEPVALLEVLLEDQSTRVEGAGLVPAEPANIEGRIFRRFEAENVAAGAAVRIAMPAIASSRRGVYVAVVLIAIGAVMLIALARAFSRRAGRLRVETVSGPRLRSADALAREIAALDAEFEREPPADREMRDAYAARRAALKEALARALAAEGRRA